jgi:hypothetical protein
LQVTKQFAITLFPNTEQVRVTCGQRSSKILQIYPLFFMSCLIQSNRISISSLLLLPAVMQEGTAGTAAAAASSSTPQEAKTTPDEELPHLRLDWQEAQVHG